MSDVRIVLAQIPAAAQHPRAHVDETSENVALVARTTEVIKNFDQQAEIAAGPAFADRVLYGRYSG